MKTLACIFLSLTSLAAFAAERQITAPAEVMGSREHQLAMPVVIYPSPLTVFCDSPTNYLGQPGIEFFLDMPTVWDESMVLSAEVGKSIMIARRSGQRWYLAVMAGDDAVPLQVPLKFLGRGKWTLRSYADRPAASDYQTVVESNQDVNANSLLPLSLAPAGGFAGIISQAK